MGVVVVVVLVVVTYYIMLVRSWLYGSMSGSGSLLGANELDRCFPDRRIRIFVGTWNMCGMRDVPCSLNDFLLPQTADFVQDAYVVGTQEAIPNRSVTGSLCVVYLLL